MSTPQPTVQFRGKCTTCQKTFAATEEDVRAAQVNGCLMSPCCMSPATVTKVSLKPQKIPT